MDYGPDTRTALQAQQLERLRWTLAHAGAHSAHYRRIFEEKRVDPDRLKSLTDLARFPFTCKADFRASYPFGLFAVPMSEISRLHASSGTTGRPTVVGYTRRDVATWAGLVARSLHAAGLRPGMKVHVAYGYGLFTGGLGAHYGAEALGCTVIPMSGGQTERQVQLIGDFQPDAILITPSYMLALLDEFRRQGLDPWASSLRYGVFGAEPWTEEMRGEIEAAFDLQATDIYGLSEVIGPGVAQEFVGRAEGLTLWEDHFYPEIVDPQSGEVLTDGAEGELVLTSLTKEALPVVRYRTGDLTRLLPGEITPMRRLTKITGRTDDMLIIRGVNLFPTQIEEQVLRCGALAPHFLIELSRSGRLDQVAIQVEARPDLPTSDWSEKARRVERLVKDAAGLSVKVTVLAPGALPRSGGKVVRVRDLRPR